MPTYLSAQRIGRAIERLSGSRAKAALFDFLIVKRTFVIKGAASVAITETEPTFIKALDEFGALYTTHLALLGNDVIVVEGLDLREVEPGDYELICLPLKIKDGDGGPARVVLRDLN